MKDFRKQKVWQKSHRLALDLYKATSGFPKEELYGLTTQIRRAGSSIPANIAEGCGRDGDAELARFLQIAKGSASELEYHLLLSHHLGYLTDADYSQLSQGTTELKQMLTSFIKKLKADRFFTQVWLPNRSGGTEYRPGGSARSPAVRCGPDAGWASSGAWCGCWRG
jgi:four helix bundle protein